MWILLLELLHRNGTFRRGGGVPSSRREEEPPNAMLCGPSRLTLVVSRGSMIHRIVGIDKRALVGKVPCMLNVLDVVFISAGNLRYLFRRLSTIFVGRFCTLVK